MVSALSRTIMQQESNPAFSGLWAIATIYNKLPDKQHNFAAVDLACERMSCSASMSVLNGKIFIADDRSLISTKLPSSFRSANFFDHTV